MITEVVGYVKTGDGVGWLSTKKLRKVLTNELLRLYLVNQMENDTKTSVTTLQDVVRHKMCKFTLTNLHTM